MPGSAMGPLKVNTVRLSSVCAEPLASMRQVSRAIVQAERRAFLSMMCPPSCLDERDLTRCFLPVRDTNQTACQVPKRVHCHGHPHPFRYGRGSGPGTCRAGRPSDADEASQHWGAINTLPKGAGLRTSAHRVRPPLPPQRRRRNTMRVLKSFSIGLLAFAVLCWPSLAGATLQNGRVTFSNAKSLVPDLTVTRSESDAMLANEIAKRIRQYVFYTIYDDVEGSVHDGVVTLTGKVTMPYKASEIGDLVARVPGVREVDNKISTLPVSTFDDELRVAIASHIYRDPLFWNYAIQVNPPIHVVVENGHVTLTGVVNSEVERRKAEAVARTTFGVFSVDNRLRLDSEMRSTR